MTDERWTEQTWIITPLPDGSVQLKGQSHEKRQADSVTQAKTSQQQQTATTAKRRQKEDEKNDVRTASKKPPNTVAIILLEWLAGIIAIVGIGYYLMKHQKKQSL